LFDQLKQLGAELQGVAFAICNKNSIMVEKWTSIGVFSHPYTIEPGEQRMYEAWKNGEEFYEEVYEGERQKKYYEAFMQIPAFRQGLQKFIDSGYPLPTWQKNHAVIFKYGYLLFITTKPFKETGIFLRFGKVFEQTYTRFLDLQKAEAQAREAKIEAALERVRARAMAMQNSDELSDLVIILFEELTKLDLILARCIIWIFDPETFTARLWMANSEDKKTAESCFVKRLNHPYYNAIIKGWQQKIPKWVYDLTGIEKKSIDELLLNETELSQLPETVKKGIVNSSNTIVSGSFNNFGFIEASGPVALTDEQMEILSRFTKVFDLTYTRFNDLQQAEANAREAIKQSALDRIRADIASMRTINDLDRITPLIWNELTTLGVPFIRCGVFIMDDSNQNIHTFLSTPDGKAIAAFHIPYNTEGNIKHVINHWRENKSYIDHWDENAFATFATTLAEQGALASPQQYLQTIPHGGFYLHFLPFLQGMLYVGNTNQLSEDEINLIQSIADAFSTAYARYEDFNKLEAAKQQIENTLVELKQTQQQLVQSEKMASLGELTAGIAHEIQNPLNFVNNFSEVSKELIDEMKIALENGDKQEAEQIASDIIQNLEKINHHGKRADAIVKGMLQHSRASTGKKELTDINALCDEYLRLSYHGLRAKDKLFNATIKTDFDPALPKVDVVPQDIGRVLLNLFNNAFYAVKERQEVEGAAYNPTVTVTTKQASANLFDVNSSPLGAAGLLITVKDNGNGIPQNIIDKIFQPFFTTKPTGQGTGLGLSLSYDIIKAHSGEIKVNSKEHEGSEFVIVLPIA
jgi:signal transduction histidine kinase